MRLIAETATRLICYFDAHYAEISKGYEPKLARRLIFRTGSLKTKPVRHRLSKKIADTAIRADN